ncbi:hypothetical protein [Cerasicoccus frondis]|uniref:hypothetical protein n=1 Tax=Cerasicoccus frondis TaxID=490090 RepID=UPI002852D696|nr:hypothetical protein [Cerasicoccus frondis]
MNQTIFQELAPIVRRIEADQRLQVVRRYRIEPDTMLTPGMLEKYCWQDPGTPDGEFSGDAKQFIPRPDKVFATTVLIDQYTEPADNKYHFVRVFEELDDTLRQIGQDALRWRDDGLLELRRRFITLHSTEVDPDVGADHETVTTKTIEEGDDKTVDVYLSAVEEDTPNRVAKVVTFVYVQKGILNKSRGYGDYARLSYQVIGLTENELRGVETEDELENYVLFDTGKGNYQGLQTVSYDFLKNGNIEVTTDPERNKKLIKESLFDTLANFDEDEEEARNGAKTFDTADESYEDGDIIQVRSYWRKIDDRVFITRFYEEVPAGQKVVIGGDQISYLKDGLLRVDQVWVVRKAFDDGAISIGSDDSSFNSVTCYRGAYRRIPINRTLDRIETSWVQPGVLSEVRRPQRYGLIEVTRVYLGVDSSAADFGAVTGKLAIVNRDTADYEGLKTYTVTWVARADDVAFSHSSPVFSIGTHVNFTKPGVAEASEETVGTKTLYDIDITSPVTMLVPATIYIFFGTALHDMDKIESSDYTYSSSSGFWSPSSWANAKVKGVGHSYTPILKKMGLRGVRAHTTNDTVSGTGDGSTGAKIVFGRRTYQDEPFSITISGGPEDPVGNRYVVDVEIAEAFQAEDGSQWFRKAIVLTDSIP